MSFANTIQIIAPAASQPEPDGQERIEHEHEADGEALRNVVHRNRGGNEEAELFPTPEGAPHAHPSANEWAVITPRMRLWLAASCVEPPGDTRTAYTSPNASHCRARVPQNNDDGHHRAPGIIPPSVTNIL